MRRKERKRTHRILAIPGVTSQGGRGYAILVLGSTLALAPPNPSISGHRPTKFFSRLVMGRGGPAGGMLPYCAVVPVMAVGHGRVMGLQRSPPPAASAGKGAVEGVDGLAQ